MKLLMLPGHMCDEAVWAPVARGVADLVTCIAGDVGRQDSIAGIAAALLADHPGSLAVAGFSFGGFVALQMARQSPERISGLALVGTMARPLPVEQRAERLRRVTVAESYGPGRYVEALLPAYLHPDNLCNPALGEAIIGMAQRIGMAALHRQVTANMARPDARPILPGLRMPTMVLCGAADAVCVPQDHRDMAEAIPGAVFTEVAMAGHFVTLEQPGGVISAMREWLGRVAAQT